ncbi:MAG: serine hydrolase [Elusimicrobia bacterium]|nr:serine hydrolase [Elusimicrobiota bacterium]
MRKALFFALAFCAAAPAGAVYDISYYPDGEFLSHKLRFEPAPKPAADAAGDEQRRDLAAMVQERVSELRRQGRLAKDENTAWAVYDFTSGEKLVEINADQKFQAASLIKPFVVLAYMHQVQKGVLAYEDDARRRFERMIQHSDNNATNWAMKRLGGPAAVQSLLRSSYGKILPNVEIVEYIPRGGRTYRNKAAVGDYSRFLLALWRDELPGAAEIKRLMALPKRDRLRTGTDLPPETEVLSKTGSTSHICGDMGVVLAKAPDGRQYAYALIGIIEKKHAARHYYRWLRSRGDIIREVSGLVYRIIGGMHGFAGAQ